MRVKVIWALSLVAALGACGSSADLPERELAWIKSADAERMFGDDVRRNRIRFLVVCGLGCDTPEVGPITYTKCYRQHAGRRTIDETGDMIMSDEHMRLKHIAEALAKVYNRRALAFLDSTGRRDCPVGERWDDLWDAMIAIADSVPQHPYATSILAYGIPKKGADFQLHVPDPVDLTDSLKARLCVLVPRFGIDSIRLRVTTGDINHNPHEERPFACHGSSVAA
jgi:hypothetical protein